VSESKRIEEKAKAVFLEAERKLAILDYELAIQGRKFYSLVKAMEEKKEAEDE
jgi:hypothetical protein